ncbi:MAG: hypothetical protein H7A33_06000 [Deltaproteobacteria bacterium]|nr:hypothetical protein [Deltaproteobacteria bacterium]
MKQITKFIIFFLLLSTPAFANSITHSIGNAGYMIREAMFADAKKLSPEKYQEAIRHQGLAKQYMRGNHPKGRSEQKALELSKVAYDLAKQARDEALAILGQKVSR